MDGQPTEGQPTRVNYFDGMLLGLADFRTEQAYHRQMRYLHNRALHGWGIVDGLAVEADGSAVLVSAGLAIDMLGRELVLSEAVGVELPPEAAADKETIWYVVAGWEEVPSVPVPSAEGTAFSRMVERCALSARAVEPDATGSELMLAIVTARCGEVASVDPSGRRPLG